MKKTYEWNLTDGRKVTLEADYSETVRNEEVNLDGDIIETGRREIVKDAMLTAYIDGKKFDSCWNVNFWKVIDAGKTGMKRIWGIKSIGFTAERAEEIERFLSSVIEEGRSEEAQEIRATEKAAEVAKEIEAAERLIAKAEAQADIPSREEAKRRMKRYNDINNEGGEGYVPYIVSREEYEYAKERISKLK